MVKSIRWEIGNQSNTYSEHILKSLVARGYIIKCEPGTRNEKGKIVRWRLITESDKPREHEPSIATPLYDRSSNSKIHALRKV